MAGDPAFGHFASASKDVLDLIAAGATREEIRDDYPLLEAGNITAALVYAARLADHPVLRGA